MVWKCSQHQLIENAALIDRKGVVALLISPVREVLGCIVELVPSEVAFEERIIELTV